MEKGDSTSAAKYLAALKKDCGPCSVSRFWLLCGVDSCPLTPQGRPLHTTMPSGSGLQWEPRESTKSCSGDFSVAQGQGGDSWAHPSQKKLGLKLRRDLEIKPLGHSLALCGDHLICLQDMASAWNELYPAVKDHASRFSISYLSFSISKSCWRTKLAMFS